MQCLVLLINKLAGVMQVLLSKFQDLQLATTLAPMQGDVQMGGNELSWVTMTTRCALDSTYSDEGGEFSWVTMPKSSHALRLIQP